MHLGPNWSHVWDICCQDPLKEIFSETIRSTAQVSDIYMIEPLVFFLFFFFVFFFFGGGGGGGAQF